MSWRDDLLEASFRRVPFFVERSEARLGRRTEAIEFPDRDVGIVQDNGMLMRGFSVDAFVIGDDYLAAKDDLATALEKAGSGTLVHPYWGTFTAALDGEVLCTESTAEGGMARFTIRFKKVGTESSTPSRPSTEDLLRSSCDVATAAAAVALGSEFSLRDFVNAVIQAVNNAIDAVLAVIEEAIAFVQGIFDAVSDLADLILSVKDAVENMIAFPQEFASKIAAKFTALIEGIFSIIGDDATAARTTSVSLDYGEPSRVDLLAGLVTKMTAPIAGDVQTEDITPAVQRGIDNRAAIETFVQTVSVIEAARAASFLTYDSYEQASGLRDSVLAAMDTVLLKVGDASYPALLATRAALVAHLSTAATSLPRIVEYTPQATLPALVLAYRLYGDAERDAEIVARNKVSHPGFVPGGVALQVISRG